MDGDMCADRSDVRNQRNWCIFEDKGRRRLEGPGPQSDRYCVGGWVGGRGEGGDPEEDKESSEDAQMTI